MERREFLRYASAGALIATSGGWAVSASAQPLLAEDHPIAVALGYKADASQVDVQKYPKRAGAEGAKQFCYNCSLYQPVDDEQGGCTAIAGQNVLGAGWCNAWVLKG